jgi:glutamine cyclotransferase
MLPSSVVVDDLHLAGVPATPFKADAMPVIDPDTILHHPIPSQLLQPISGRDPEILKSTGPVEEHQLAQGNPLDLNREPSRSLAGEDAFGVGIPKAADHVKSLTRGDNNVKR